MKINNYNIKINEAIQFADFDKLLLKRRNNKMLLSDYQVDVLRRNGLNYEKYIHVNDLLFDIETILANNYDDELDLVSSQLAEFIYYRDTKK